MDLKGLWQNVQEELKISVSQTTYRGMLAQTTLQDFEKNASKILKKMLLPSVAPILIFAI